MHHPVNPQPDVQQKLPKGELYDPSQDLNPYTLFSRGIRRKPLMQQKTFIYDLTNPCLEYSKHFSDDRKVQI